MRSRKASNLAWSAMMAKNRRNMKWRLTDLLTRRNLVTAFILLVGLVSSILIYLTADNASDGVSVDDIENSKRYVHDLELYGGKANVLVNELRNWFIGLWHGKSLAFMVACITIITALGYFLFASDSKSGARDETKGG